MPNWLCFRRKKKNGEEEAYTVEPEPEPEHESEVTTPPPEVEPKPPSPPPTPPAPPTPPTPPPAPPSQAPSVHKDAESCVGPLYPELICCGCNKMYTNPFLLPCNDSVCETCLHQMKSEMKADKKGYFTIKCPICTLEFHFESMRDIKFPENYLLQIILQEQKRKANGSLSSSASTGMLLEESKLFCQLCDQKFPRSTIKRCITCSLNFCEKCLNEIHGNKAFLSHTLSDTIYITDTPIRCHIHPENEIIMYCSTDHALLCEACLVEGHENHNNRPIHDAFQTETKEVLGMSSNFRKVVESSERNIAKLNSLKTELDETESEIDQRLFKEFLTLHKEMQLQHTYLNERLKSEKLKKKIHIDNFLDSVSQSVCKMEGLEQFITEALKQVNPAVFLQMANPIKMRIKSSLSNIVQPSNSLAVNPLKELKFDFTFIRAQINNIHLKVMQPEHIVYYAEGRHQPENKGSKDETLSRSVSGLNKKDSSKSAESRHQAEKKCAKNGTVPKPATTLNKKDSCLPAEDRHHPESKGSKNGTVSRPVGSMNKNESSISAKSTSVEEDEDDCKEDDDTPSENANNHHFESVYANSDNRKSPPTITECPSESQTNLVDDKDIQCVVTECEYYEPTEPDACPDQIVSPVSGTNKQTFVPHKKDCQPNHAEESLRKTDSDTSVWLCCEISNEGNKEENINGYLKDDAKEVHGNKKKLQPKRVSSDHKTEKRPKSSPSLVNGNCVKPAISYHSSSRTDLAKNPPDDTWLTPLLPGKPTIFEHTADANSAKIYWGLLNEDEAVKYYEVQLQEMKPENGYHQCSLRDQSGLFSGIKNEVFKAKELNANSEYMFRVRAVNSAGRGEWSDPYKVSTVNSFIVKNDRRGCAAIRGHCGRMQAPRITYYQTGD